MPSFEISSPDGATYSVDAPDQHSAINIVAKLHPTKPAGPPSTLEDIKKDVGPAVARTAAGIAGLPAAASQALDYIPSWVLAHAAEKAGMLPKGKTASDMIEAFQKTGQPKPGETGGMPADIGPVSGEQAQRFIEKATGPLSEPQTPGGKLFETAVNFAPGALGPIAGLGSRVVKNVIAPAIGSEAAGGAARALGLNEGLAKFVGGLGTSAALHGLTPRPNPDVVEAGERQGIAIPKGIASDNPLVEQMGTAASKIPIVGTPLDLASQRFMGSLGTRMEGLASQATGGGQGATRLVSGMATRNAMEDWITGESAVPVKAAYARRDAALTNPQALTPLNETQTAMADALASRQASRLPDRTGPAVREVQEAAMDPNGLTVEGLQGLRTRIRLLRDDSMLPEAWDKTELGNIYNGLTKDLEQAHLNAGGQPALDAWRGANRVADSIAGRRKAVASIIGEDASAAPEKVFDKILRIASDKAGGDTRLLAQARSAIGPSDWQELASGVIGRLGRDPEGNFSPQRFSTAFGNLSDSGKAVLFRRLPSGDNYLSSLQDIATISSKWRQAQRFANPSGTAQAGALVAAGTGLIAEPMTTLATLAGGRVVAQVLASPASASSLAKWATAYGRYANSPGPAALSALTLASRNFSKTAKGDLGVNIPVEGLLSGQSAVPGDTGGGKTPLQ